MYIVNIHTLRITWNWNNCHKEFQCLLNLVESSEPPIDGWSINSVIIMILMDFNERIYQRGQRKTTRLLIFDKTIIELTTGENIWSRIYSVGGTNFSVYE